MATVEVLGIQIQVDDAQLGKLQDGLQKVGVAAKQVGADAEQAAAGTKQLGDAHEEAGRKASEHGSNQTTLHEILGASRRETNFLEGALVAMSGAEGVAGQAASALASGIGPVGIAVVGATLAIKAYTEWLDEAAKKEQHLAEIQVRGAGSDFAEQQKQKIADLDKQIQEASKDLVLLKSAAANADPTALFQVDPSAVANAEQLLQSLIAMRDHIAGGAQSTAEMRHELRQAAADAGTVELDFRNIAIDAEAAASKIGGMSHSIDSLKQSSDNYEKNNPYLGSLAARSAALDQEAREIGARQKSITDQRVSEAKREADALAAFQRQVSDASSVASTQVQADMQAIANSTLSAAEKTQVLHMYLAKLPAHIRSQIEIAIQTHADALLMRLLGAGGGAKGGHQQGNQWDFTFEGEDPATRLAFLNANNNDVEAARAAWYAQHAAELEAQGIEKPDNWNSPYMPAGTQMASGGIVTRPTRALIGEAGPEAIIPLDKAGVGGNVTLNFTQNVYGISTAQEEEVRPVILPMLERAIHEIESRR